MDDFKLFLERAQYLDLETGQPLDDRAIAILRSSLSRLRPFPCRYSLVVSSGSDPTRLSWVEKAWHRRLKELGADAERK